MYRMMDCSSGGTAVIATVENDNDTNKNTNEDNTNVLLLKGASQKNNDAGDKKNEDTTSSPNIVEDDGDDDDANNEEKIEDENKDDDEFHDAEQPMVNDKHECNLGEPAKNPKNNLPKAGSSTLRLPRTSTEFTTKDNAHVNQNASFVPEWKPVIAGAAGSPDCDEVPVRTKGYLKTGIKKPSQQSLYEIAAFDLIMSENRVVGEVSTRVQLPDQFGEPSATADDKLKGVYAPKSLVIVLAVPEETPRIGRPRDDGRGLNFILYFQMKDITISILHKIQNGDYENDYTKEEKPLVPAVKLLDEWFRRTSGDDPDTEFASRFKFVPFSPNATTILPSSMSKYNGKPLLIKRTGATGLHVHNPAIPNVPLREFCINFHAFPYLAKQAFSYTVRNYLEAFVMRTCFVIEGRDDDELPEVIIGGASICCSDPKAIVWDTAFFSGMK
eukprot:CAMPEP_0196815156 /NCGR_PEP_ID=MMETSP1362-20130617/48109_1 /TAXON_ID=163516 /ORGANISM="Leptocylindrus danicus, Strain CCMP1856" /LENGTH=441 /DNA_ID=CAMNT_0042192017 /DNA_START=370 /DNA_END=1695 /DNA_ORIENTATION=+